MSHYICYVITRHGTEEEAEGILSLFSEDKEMRPYDATCHCVGSRAQHRVEKAVEKQYPLKKMREEFHKKYPADKHADELLQILWKRECAFPRESYRDELLLKQKDRITPSAKCKDCGGSGIRQTMCNPHSQWDWYELGGRWKKIFRNNAITVKALLARLKNGKDVPYAFITPEGEWHAQGEMGWFGASSGDIEEREWLDICRAFFAQYPSCTVLLYDLHI